MPGLEPLANLIGRRECPKVPMSPSTTLGELISLAQENVCFDVLYLALAYLEQGRQIRVDGVDLTGEVASQLEMLRWSGCDVSQFCPDWLTRMRELLNTIAKERGYEPPNHHGPDRSGTDAGNEEQL